MINVKIYALIFIVAPLIACSPPNDETTTEPEKETDSGNSLVLARVEGKAITEADLHRALERNFSDSTLLLSDEGLRSNLLKSVMASKAMGIVSTKELSVKTLDEIKQKVKSYEEELLVKEYLLLHAIPEPVSNQMVSDYYYNNLSQFGAEKIKLIELVKTNVHPSVEQRDEFLAQLTTIKNNANWAQYTKDNNKNIGLRYQKIKLQRGLLDKATEAAANKLNAGEVSNVVFIEGVPTIIRLLEVQTIVAKPLAEVSAEIRRKLAPIQIKKAVKKASEKALNDVQVIVSEK
jgi:hypothetical protein